MESTGADLGSFEGKYPKDLFNKNVVAASGLAVGHVAKETDNTIVVFSDSGDLRYDIPKSKIEMSGSSAVVTEPLEQYIVDRDAPMPPDRTLRPSGEEIRALVAEQQQLETQENKGVTTTPDAVIEDSRYLSSTPRPETTGVTVPEGYVDTESELSRRLKGAVSELKQVIVAGGRVAKRKATEAKAQAEEKRAEFDAESISRMGELATRYTDTFEEVVSEIRTKTYADQVPIYDGFLKLIDQQRNVVLAQRDLALRLRDSVLLPVVEDETELEGPQESPEEIGESRMLNERGSTAATNVDVKTNATSATTSSSQSSSSSSSQPTNRRPATTSATTRRSSKTTSKRKKSS
ncbi:MAG TPA: hypothetical protein VNI77_11660 [Nitrososphaera sp.]|nr:hypothetical protein [Nitrososphaera sp.]